MAHESVLLKEILEGFSFEEGDIYLDATVGSGGHMEAVWNKMSNRVELYGIDADETSVDITRERLNLAGAKPRLAVLNFRNIDKILEIFSIKNPTKILFDLGWCSDQLDTPEGKIGRGFSFQRNEPLIMTFKNDINKEDTTAYDIVNKWDEKNLADIIYGYGEEKYARRITRAIVENRKREIIKTSDQLAKIIKEAVPVFYRFGRIHPATKTFQAIRIAVNDELQTLKIGLQKAFCILKRGGIIGVISFHSLEDRIVKQFFRNLANKEWGKILNKKPIVPSNKEIEINSRARSAKLRFLKKISG
ncbi:MAG: 16S rRNA (cytosine(1402)-N(4))-methyltransferase RsmH [Candidatus Zambryskibacteria bacterium]|nr:16S rRNA (cytosine(1402)-N(4))-methyltransferase RsmH [Candidatus Zambryskibacteria bacterium]